MAVVSASVTRRRQAARDLRIHAHVVERTGQDRRHDVAGVGAGGGRRTVIAALAGRDRTDDQPYEQDNPADPHIYLRKTRGSCHSPEPQTRVAPSSTPLGTDTRTRPAPSAADPIFTHTGGASTCVSCAGVG